MRTYDPDGRLVPAHAPFARAPFAPPPPPAEQTRQPATCARCGQRLVYVEMDATGKLNPCDPEQRYGDGRRHLVVRYPRGKKVVGRMIARAGEDVMGLEPHWGTCPNRPAKETAPAESNTQASGEGCTVYHLPPR